MVVSKNTVSNVVPFFTCGIMGPRVADCTCAHLQRVSLSWPRFLQGCALCTLSGISLELDHDRRGNRDLHAFIQT